ncbi:arylsulfatase precursor [Seiridium cupressi]
MRYIGLLSVILTGTFPYLAQTQNDTKTQPNIILIFTDDQDLHLGSLDYMPILQKELAEKGTQFNNHYCTVAQCCPSRASLLRGQAAHNTNITDVQRPGGNYQKWLLSNENDEYLPHWLIQAGYNAEYIGKFMNGFNRGNYMNKPKGWDHTDILLKFGSYQVVPWVYNYNKVVMTANGETPKIYHGFHQLDIIRTKALDRIDKLAADSRPFYLTIAPSAPHVQSSVHMAVPQKRHNGTHKDAKVSRNGNYNPEDKYQKDKPSWLKNIPLMSEDMKDFADTQYAARLDTLQGVDEIIEDVVDRLDKLDILDNTFIVYTTDNGYHLGNHRVAAGKSLPYREDTNLPLIVRGPGVPEGKVSNLPSAHLDFPPTFLDIAGVKSADFPAMLDGRSVLDNWKNPESALPSCSMNDPQEIINVEFWGTAGIESPLQNASHRDQNSYKTLRIVGEQQSYLYSRWCNDDVELYDTLNDPFELTNLAAGNDTEVERLQRRLNALLLATKSCAGQTCRNPWKLLQPDSPGVIVEDASALTITCLDQAMQSKYDEHFRSFEQVHFSECEQIQSIANEAPFLPKDPTFGLEYRSKTDYYQDPDTGPTDPVPDQGGFHGGPDQRDVTLEAIMSTAEELTKGQLGQS